MVKYAEIPSWFCKNGLNKYIYEHHIGKWDDILEKIMKNIVTIFLN